MEAGRWLWKLKLFELWTYPYGRKDVWSMDYGRMDVWTMDVWTYTLHVWTNMDLGKLMSDHRCASAGGQAPSFIVLSSIVSLVIL